MKDKDKTFFEYPVFENVRDMIYNAIKEYPNHVAFRIKEKENEKVKYIDNIIKNIIQFLTINILLLIISSFYTSNIIN